MVDEAIDLARRLQHVPSVERGLKFKVRFAHNGC